MPQVFTRTRWLTMMRILAVVGTRPNLVKIAPLMRAMRHHGRVEAILVHTGQHYDHDMSGRLIDELDIPSPDRNLGVASGSHAVQTAEIMKRLDPVLRDVAPDLVLVVGDVNSTLAAALTAAKRGIAVAHVEAGLRSFDRTMPEEINRVVTDALSTLLLVSEESGRENLLREGVPPDRIHLVGNVMIDALEMTRARWERSDISQRLGLGDGPYAVATLHRPANVDHPGRLHALLTALDELGARIPVIFPVHPRVAASTLVASRGGIVPAARARSTTGVRLTAPLGYLDFIALLSRARLVLTDSGGVQEETTYLGIPCLTLRECTERPATVTHGTNRVIGTDSARIQREARDLLASVPRPHRVPPLWDGGAAPRIVRVLAERFDRARTAANP
jgi:UDP-N-acetylglucosamine 2-epimerase (non-hydrolysing)